MELGTRRRRRSSEPGPAGGADYLSALPEDLLLLVLARLGCAAAAARTGLLSRRWRGLWARLRDLAFRGVAFPSLQAALGRVSRPPPAVSLLEIRVPCQNWPEGGPAAGAVTSLLRAAALLAPEKLVFTFPSDSDLSSAGVDLPCHRATSIVLESIPFVLRAPAAGGGFPALQTLSLTSCQVDDLGALLSLCPHLRALRLKGPSWHGGDNEMTTVHSASLQELVMENIWTNRVDIVAPILKQLMVSLHSEEQCLFPFWDEEASFAEEIEKHMVADFSALELHLTTTGHVFEAFVSHLLGLTWIRSVIRRLKVVLQTSQEIDVCPAVCPCQPKNWWTQIISLTALEEVEIDGFEGEDHELDFLKLVFSCAPMLKTMVVKLSDEVSSSDDRITKICDIFRGYSSVKCNVYLSSGVMHHSENCRLT
ncbi:hypothetical protein ACQJBY_066576 [Aegilops geniculata]